MEFFNSPAGFEQAVSESKMFLGRIKWKCLNQRDVFYLLTLSIANITLHHYLNLISWYTVLPCIPLPPPNWIYDVLVYFYWAMLSVNKIIVLKVDGQIWVWYICRMILKRENWSTWRKNATLSTTNPTCTGLGLNLGLCSEKPATETWYGLKTMLNVKISQQKLIFLLIPHNQKLTDCLIIFNMLVTMHQQGMI